MNFLLLKTNFENLITFYFIFFINQLVTYINLINSQFFPQ